MKIKKVSSVFLISLLMLTGCSSQYPHYRNEQEAFSLAENAAKEAIVSTDFAGCLFLPVEARYYDEYTSTDNVVIKPRANCLWEYLESKKDIQVCNLLEKFGTGPQSGMDCFDYLAKNNIPLQSQCEKISDPNESNTCLALVNEDIQYCQKLGSKISKGWCIHDVVFRTRNIKPCLEIEGPDYGENWKKIRNECIIVGALNSIGKEKTLQCNSIVEDSLDKKIRERCLVGADGNIELAPLR